jgi:hypothetical protein
VTNWTVTAVLDAPQEEVFEFLSRVENLPEWATEFARELKYEDGKFFFTIEADPRTGVIDMFAGPTEHELAFFPTRVIALGSGQTAYSFTMFQAPGMPDELFESQRASLQREFDNIRAHFTGKPS